MEEIKWQKYIHASICTHKQSVYSGSFCMWDYELAFLYIVFPKLFIYSEKVSLLSSNVIFKIYVSQTRTKNQRHAISQ